LKPNEIIKFKFQYFFSRFFEQKKDEKKKKKNVNALFPGAKRF
jgi:hypothetical protein